MPPLGMHVALAKELAPELGDRSPEAEPGAYYLGATSPDIRVITRWDRERTHFFNLGNLDEQRGAERIFREHPELASREDASPGTAAFLAGYISHLEMDEAWITGIYRPCFGEGSALKGDVLANLLDRVLQYELDRRGREDAAAISTIRCDLLESAIEVAVGFIDSDTLGRWRDVTAELLEREQTWDRFGVIASRHLRAYGVESEEDVAHFLRNVPDLLNQAIREVTPERIETFHERSRQRALAAMLAYLS